MWLDDNWLHRPSEDGRAENREYVVLTTGVGAQVDLSQLRGDLRVYGSAVEASGCALPFVIILDGPDSAGLLEHATDPGPVEGQVWIDVTQLEVFWPLMRSHEDWTITGVQLNPDMLRLFLVRASRGSRRADDLIAGLILGLGNAQAQLTSKVPKPQGVGESAMPTTVARISKPSSVVRAVLPVARPLKRYLPPRVVAGLYQLLDKGKMK